MEGGLIWLTIIAGIIVLAAIIVGIAAFLRWRRRSLK